MRAVSNLLSQAQVMAVCHLLKGWWGMSPPWSQEPFEVLSHHAQDAFLLPRLLSWPLVNDHSSLPHSFTQFLFNILINYLLIYLRFSRPKVPSPLNEKQKDSLAWLFSQLVPTPPHPPHLSPCASSKAVRLCCLTTLAQERPRYLSAVSCKWVRCDPNIGFASLGGPWARCNPRMKLPWFWCHSHWAMKHTNLWQDCCLLVPTKHQVLTLPSCFLRHLCLQLWVLISSEDPVQCLVPRQKSQQSLERQDHPPGSFKNSTLH